MTVSSRLILDCFIPSGGFYFFSGLNRPLCFLMLRSLFYDVNRSIYFKKISVTNNIRICNVGYGLLKCPF